MPSLRATVACSVLALVGCAYDWSLPEGGGAGGAGGAGPGGDGGAGAQGAQQGAGGEGGAPPCAGDVESCVEALCGGQSLRRCAPRVCAGRSAQECAGLVCGRGLEALRCVTELCVRFEVFCRDYTDE